MLKSRLSRVDLIPAAKMRLTLTSGQSSQTTTRFTEEFGPKIVWKNSGAKHASRSLLSSSHRRRIVVIVVNTFTIVVGVVVVSTGGARSLPNCRVVTLQSDWSKKRLANIFEASRSNFDFEGKTNTFQRVDVPGASACADAATVDNASVPPTTCTWYQLDLFDVAIQSKEPHKVKNR